MSNRPHVFLIPGFFGFAHVGDVAYFHHVETTLKAAMAQRGHDVEVVTVPTLPTAGLRQRAERLLATIQSHAGEQEPLILVGHSTGGLDARLMTTPGVELEAPWPVEPVAERVKSIVFLSTPHRGTPVAAFFTSIAGQQPLKLLGDDPYTLRSGRLPLTLLGACRHGSTERPGRRGSSAVQRAL